MKRISSIRKAWALMIALSCYLSVLPMNVYAENETPAPEEETSEVNEILEENKEAETAEPSLIVNEAAAEEKPAVQPEAKKEAPAEEKDASDSTPAKGVQSVRGNAANIGNTELTWEISDTTLTISGTGEMPEYTDIQDVPWYSEAGSIETLKIGQQVSRVNPKALNILTSLRKIEMIHEDGVADNEDYFVFANNRSHLSYSYVLVRNIRNDEGTITGKVIDFADVATGYQEDTYTFVSIPEYITGISAGVFPTDRDIDVFEVFMPRASWQNLSVDEDNNALNEASTVYEGTELEVGDIFAEGKAGENITWEAKVKEKTVNGENTAYVFDEYFTGSGTVDDWYDDLDIPFWAWINYEHALSLNIESVYVGDGITRIGDFGLSGYDTVKNIYLPASLTELGKAALTVNFALENIVIAEDNHNFKVVDNCILFNYDYSTLYAYPVLRQDTSYSIPNTVTAIADYAFCNNYYIETVNVPGSVTAIGSGAFSSCNHLSSIYLPENMTEIKEHTFEFCPLQTITLPRGIQSISTFAFGADFNTRILYPGTYSESQSIQITDLETYGEFLTFDLIELSNCGDNLTWTIENRRLIISGDGPMWNFGNKDEGSTAKGNTAAEYGSDAPWSDADFRYVEIGEGVTSIGRMAFSRVSYIEYISMPSTLMTVDSKAFLPCEIVYFMMPEENPYLSVDHGALYNKEQTELLNVPSRYDYDDNVIELTIPPTVTKIGPYAIYYPTRLDSIEMPASVTYIDENGINLGYGNTKLKYDGRCADLFKADQGGLDNYFRNVLFTKCGDDLTWFMGSTDNGDPVLVIEGTGDMWDFEKDLISSDPGKEFSKNQFGNVAPWIYASERYAYMDLPEGITGIGDYAFFDHQLEFEEFTIPNNIVRIGDGAFSGFDSFVYKTENHPVFTAVDGVLFTRDMKTLIRYPWDKSCEITDYIYTIPDGVENIAAGAFYWNNTIGKLNIPVSVKSIGDYAFIKPNTYDRFDAVYSGTYAQFDQIACNWRLNYAIDKSDVEFANPPASDLSCEFENGVLTFSGHGSMPGLASFPETINLSTYYANTHTIVIEEGLVSICEGLLSSFTELETLILPRYFGEISGEVSNSTLNHVIYNGKVEDFVNSGLEWKFEDSMTFDFPYCGDNMTWTLDNGVLSITGSGEMWYCDDSGNYPWSYLEVLDDVISVQMSDEITSIPFGAFYGMRSVTDFTVGKGVREIETQPFGENYELEEIKVAEGNQYFTSADGVLFTKDMKVLVAYPGGKKGISYMIPEGTEGIFEDAFDGSFEKRGFGTYLTEITLPRSLLSIGWGVFRGYEPCLEKVSYTGTYSEWIQLRNNIADYNQELTYYFNEHYDPVFVNCGDNVTWSYSEKDQVLTISGTGPMWEFGSYSSGGIEVQSVSSSVSSSETNKQYFGTASSPWSMCGYEPKKIVISEGVTAIGKYAFSQEHTDYISIPSSVTKIGSDSIYSTSAEKICYAGTEAMRAGITVEANNDLDFIPWVYSYHNVFVEENHGCDLEVTYQDGDETIEITSSAVVPEVTLTVRVHPTAGYQLKEGVAEEYTVLADHEIHINADDLAEKGKNLKALDDLLNSMSASIGDIEQITIDVPEGGNLETIVSGIDAARMAGQNITFEVIDSRIDLPEDSPEAVQVRTAAGDADIIDYYDVKLVLRNDDAVLASISKTIPEMKITVTLPLSDEAKAEVEAGGTCRIVGVHDGEAEIIPCTVIAGEDDTYYVSFETYKFSTYAVAVSQRVFSPAVLNSASLTLNGDIGVNFYMTIDDNDADYLYIHLVCGSKDVRLLAKDAVKNQQHGRKFQIKVNAKQMNADIKIYAEDKNGVKQPLKTQNGSDYTECGYTYTVATYLSQAKQVGSEKLQELAKAMDNYGKYTQIYFNYPEGVSFDPAPDSVEDVTAEDLAQYETVSTGTVPTGLSIPEISLILDSTISLRVYFTVEEGKDIKDYAFTIDGQAAETGFNEIKRKYYVSVDNIPANELGNPHEITVSGGNTYTLSNCSALSYAKLVLDKQSDTSMTAEEITKLNQQKDVVRALYLYNQAAVAYFN